MRNKISLNRSNERRFHPKQGTVSQKRKRTEKCIILVLKRSLTERKGQIKAETNGGFRNFDINSAGPLFIHDNTFYFQYTSQLPSSNNQIYTLDRRKNFAVEESIFWRLLQLFESNP